MSISPSEIEKRSEEKVPVVKPLQDVKPPEVAQAAGEVDRWLQSISGGYVNLERIKTVAGALPIIGNIMSLVDALCDVIAIVTRKARSEAESFFDWVSLAINLIGIAPGAGGAMRMGLRPLLQMLRQKLRTSSHDIGTAVLVVLQEHVNATVKGELEKFVDGARDKLQGLLGEAGALGRQITASWAEGLRRLARGQLFVIDPPPEMPRYDPKIKYDNFFAAAVGALAKRAEALGQKAEQLAKEQANAVFKQFVVGTSIGKTLERNADLLNGLGAQIEQKLAEQGNDAAERSIGWLLFTLKKTLSKGRSASLAAALNGKTTSRRDAKKGNKELSVVNNESTKVKKDGNCCTATGGQARAARGTTGRSINYATGSETFVHIDFVLPGLMPIVWSRSYCSRLGAYDSPVLQGSDATAPAYLGARWTTAYTTRIEQARDGSLRYFGADGRTHEFPRLAGPSEDEPGKVGQTHHDPIEDLTLGRGNDGLLILSHGRDYIETFELAPTFWRGGKAHVRNKAVCYRLASQRTREGHTTELSYRHEGGQLSDIVSGNNHVSTDLDEQGRIQSLWLVQHASAVRQLASYTYQDQADGSSDLVAAQDENQETWHYDYLRLCDQGSTHLISRYTDRTGRGTHLRWMHEDGFAIELTGGNSERAKAWHERADDGSFDTTIIWNRHVRLATVINALGGETLYYYDELGYIYRVVYPAVSGKDGKLIEHEEWFFRDARRNITTHLHPDGTQDNYTYDAHGNLASHTQADASVIYFAYDEMDNVTGILDAEGHAWKRTFDGTSLVEEIDPLGHKTAYACNDAGMPVEITDAKGGKKQLAYDDAGQLIAYTDCSGKTSRWAYDERGRLVRQSNAAGEITQYHHARGQLAGITHPDGAQEHFDHDAEGRLLVHRDPLQRETRYEYTVAGQIAQRIDANRHTLDYQWDSLGRLIALRNENGRTHKLGYDAMGKLLTEVHFDRVKTSYGYNAATGVLHQISEGNALTQLEFDPVGRLLMRSAALYIEPADSHGQPTGRTVDREHAQVDRYAYDGNGRLVDARNTSIQLQWFHDAAGNTRTEHHHYLIDDQARPSSQPLTAVWQHRYDELGNRIQTTRPDGHVITWLTYGSGHVHGLMLDDQEVLQIERDDLHREIERTQANEIAQEQQYDRAGRLKTQVLSRARQLGQSRGANGPNSAAFGVRRSYSYDRAGQLTDIGDSRRGHLSYGYDPVGRLLQAQSRFGTETFAFDPASNILDPMAPTTPTARQAGTRDNTSTVLNNLVKDYAGTHFEYDVRGNMVQRLHNGQRTRFMWDALGRLSEARTHDTRTSFLYDPLGRRIAKRSEPVVASTGMNGSHYQAAESRRQIHERGLGTVLFGWDGDQMAWESNSARNRTVHYVFEPNTFVPMLQAGTPECITQSFLKRPASATSTYVDEQGDYDMGRDPLHNGNYAPGLGRDGEPPAPLENIHYYQCDHLGTPMEMTDESGNIAWEANYKAWGEARLTISEAARKAGLKNPIRFQGQYLDEETGLHYNRFRYYDPVVGRFVSKDPAGLITGSNQQEFAPNPVQWIDPFGLWKGQPRQPGGRFQRGRDPNSLASQKSIACSAEGNVHGNSLESKLPAVGYVLVDRDNGAIVKYGETTQIPATARYSDAEYEAMNARMRIVKTGSKREMHCWQHQQILAYRNARNGQRPRYNFNDY
jgi:RHS repeat-associated protein